MAIVLLLGGCAADTPDLEIAQAAQEDCDVVQLVHGALREKVALPEGAETFTIELPGPPEGLVEKEKHVLFFAAPGENGPVLKVCPDQPALR